MSFSNTDFPRTLSQIVGFIARYWKAFCSLLGASVSLSSGFHLQANQELDKLFRCFVSTQTSNWSKFLAWVEYAHNTLPNTCTGLLNVSFGSGLRHPAVAGGLRGLWSPGVGVGVGACPGHLGPGTFQDFN